MSLKQRTVSGIAWNSVARVVSQGLYFGIMVVLVRLLTPEDFGVLAMVTVFIGFAQLINDFGFGPALIQRRDITDAHVSSVFWVNLLIGFCLLGIFYASAPFIAQFYEEPQVEPLAQVLGLLFVIAALGIVPRALLQRAMTFDAIAKVEIVSVTISGALAITLAFQGWGVWSLVAQRLMKEAIDTLLSWAFVNRRPGIQFSAAAMRDILGFSLGFSGFTFINYWARKSDDLLIGKFMGSSSLGIYDRAYQLMLFPITQIIGVISKVMFPAFSSIQHDKVRIKRIYLQTTGLLALIIFPMMFGLFVVAEPFVIAVFGERWAEVASIIEILCFVGVTQTLCNPTGWIYTSQGRTDWMFWWGVGGAGALILAIVIGVLFGTVQTVAMAYLIANILITYPCIAIPGKLIDMSAHEVMREVAGALACSIVMAGAVWGVGWLLPTAWSPMLRLAVMVPAGIVTYAVLVIVGQLKAYKTLRRLVLEQGQGIKS